MRSSSSCALARRAALSAQCTTERGDDEAAGEDYPRQARGSTLTGSRGTTTSNRWPATANVLLAVSARSRACVEAVHPADHCVRRVGRRCKQTQVSIRRPPRAPGRSTSPMRFERRRDQEEPARAGSRGGHRGRGYVIEAARPGERRGHPRCTAQIGAGHGHGREARHKRRREIGGARSGWHHPAARVGRHDGLPDTPLVRRTP